MMETMMAFIKGQAARASGSPSRTFDWIKAAQTLRERNPSCASAGLIEDWGYTGGPIWEGGKPVPKEDTYVYLTSTWATPVLRFNDEIIECWKYASEVPDEDRGYWPPRALEIIQSSTGSANK